MLSAFSLGTKSAALAFSSDSEGHTQQNAQLTKSTVPCTVIVTEIFPSLTQPNLHRMSSSNIWVSFQGSKPLLEH